MSNARWHQHSLQQLTKALDAGETSSAALTRHFLARMDQHQQAINAVVARNDAQALATAEQCDAERNSGQLRGPLHGIPMTVKDCYETVGFTACAGAPALAGHQPRTNAPAVQKLIDAGAIIIGKTNVPLFAADFQSYNKVYGTTNNPWDTSRIPGGSSGGSAAALAAGLSTIELGSDIGGSLRNPAHYCGVYSHKPSYGLVSMRGHIPGPPGTLSVSDMAVAGPMSRHPADLRQLLPLLCGAEEPEQRAWSVQLPDCDWPLEKFRVLAWLEDASCPIDSAMQSGLRALCERLRAAGVQVTESAPLDLPTLREHYELFLKMLTAVMGGGAPEKLYKRMKWAARSAKLTGKPPADSMLGYAIGGVQSHRDWLKAVEARERLRMRWEALFEDYDLVLMPVVPTTAIKHQQDGNLFKRRVTVNGQARPYADHMAWISPPMIGGQPVTTAPVALIDGLPYGLQIAGPCFHDLRTIRFAELIRELSPAMSYPLD